MYLKTGHDNLNKPLQHWRNIRGFAPDLNIGDPDGESLVDTDEDDVEVDVEDGDGFAKDEADRMVGDKVPSSLLR